MNRYTYTINAEKYIKLYADSTEDAKRRIMQELSWDQVKAGCTVRLWAEDTSLLAKYVPTLADFDNKRQAQMGDWV